MPSRAPRIDADRAVGDDVAVAQHVVAPRGRGANLVVVEPRRAARRRPRSAAGGRRSRRSQSAASRRRGYRRASGAAGPRRRVVQLRDAHVRVGRAPATPSSPAVPRPRRTDRSARGARARRAHPRRDRRRRVRGRASRPSARSRAGAARAHRRTTSSSSSTRTRAGATATGAPADGEAVPYARADPRPTARRTPRSVIADLGWYSHDNDAILAGTWAAAIGAVDVTLSAWRRRCRRSTRPRRTRSRGRPGHHAAADSYAGYCFLNNAAIAAQAWTDRGARVAILDVDYHHGNGTQQIFYDRDDVCFVSLHADPADEYPFFLGLRRRARVGSRRGVHAQLPAPARHRVGRVRSGARRGRGRDQRVRSRRARRLARRRHRGRGPRHVPARRRRLHAHRRRDRRARLPTLFVQEGGYDLERDRPQRRERAARRRGRLSRRQGGRRDLRGAESRSRRAADGTCWLRHVRTSRCVSESTSRFGLCDAPIRTRQFTGLGRTKVKKHGQRAMHRGDEIEHVR